MMKKRIIIVTKFYYRRGGDCIYALNLEKLLREQGHDVAVFAMQYGDNEESRWAEYWPAEVNFGGGAKEKLSAVRRTLGMGDVRKAFARLLKDFKPDIVHLNNIHSYISPMVGEMAHKAGVRVVWTLHDYKLLCPAYSCLRDGKPCELCFNSKLPVVKTRCMKGSLAASAVAYLEARRWNRRKLEKNTDTFICPSSFMASKMRQGGFKESKLLTLSNFISPEMKMKYSSRKATPTPDDYYCYIGRLSDEKGVETLLMAATRLPYKLKVTGDGPLAEKLTKKYAGCKNIEFTGKVSADKVHDILSKARLSVMPSECYENNPLGVIESFCAGTPVVGAEIGGIPELVTDDRGITFKSGDADSLIKAIETAWNKAFDRESIQDKALEEFSPSTYYSHLEDIYF